MYSQALAVKDKLVTNVGMSGRVHCVLPESSYSPWRDRIGAHAEIDLFGSNDMKNMTRILGKAITRELTDTCFVFLYIFPSCNRLLLSIERKNKPLSGKVLASRGLKEREARVYSCDWRLRQKTLHYIRAVGSHQQLTVVKCAAHNSGVKMTIHSWQTIASWREVLGHTNY